MSLTGKWGILCFDNASYSSDTIEQLFTAASQRIPEFHMLGCSCKKIQALDTVMHFHAELRRNCMFYNAFSLRSILF